MELSASRLRLIAGLTVAAGLVALGVTVAFRLLPQVTGAGSCVAADAMVRFELARSQAALQPIFAACRPQAISAMDAINRLDLAAYIPSYNAFAALAAIFLARSARRPLVIAAIVAAVVTLVADYMETTTLLRISPDLEGAGPLLTTSSTAAWVKFGFLAVNAALLSAICLTAAPRRPILGVLLVLPVLGTIAMALDLRHADLLTYGYLLSWTPVLAVAGRTLVTGKP